jgi:SAM-dependent methyltransferase
LGTGGYYLDPATYDQVHSDVVADIAPHVAAARGAEGRVLEVCCGTGRLLVPIVEAGVACDGLDLEADMVAYCRARLAARGLQAEVVTGDMRDFTRPHRYALVAIGFNSFLHNLTQDDQLRTLRCCREHLVKDLPLPGVGRLRVHDRAEDDRVEQIRSMTRRLEWLRPNGSVEAEREVRFDLRYVYKPEMELLLRTVGFARWSVAPLAVSLTDPASAAAPGAPARESDLLRWTAWRS